MKTVVKDLGRITLPIKMRKELEIEVGDEIDIKCEDKQIVITNPDRIGIKPYILERKADLEKMVKETEQSNVKEWFNAKLEAYNDILKEMGGDK